MGEVQVGEWFRIGDGGLTVGSGGVGIDPASFHMRCRECGRRGALRAGVVMSLPGILALSCPFCRGELVLTGGDVLRQTKDGGGVLEVLLGSLSRIADTLRLQGEAIERLGERVDGWERKEPGE